MKTDLVKAMNRLARAMERNNNEKVQRKLMRVRVEEFLKTLDDAIVVKRVTEVLTELMPKPEPIVYPSAYFPLPDALPDSAGNGFGVKVKV